MRSEGVGTRKAHNSTDGDMYYAIVSIYEGL
jgi:hypothetical protein